MTGTETLTVFEIVNEPLREIFLGATAQPVHEVMHSLVRRPPSVLAHWDFNKLAPGCLRVVEGGLSPATAQEFLRIYLKTTLPEGWRFVSSEPLGGRGG